MINIICKKNAVVIQLEENPRKALLGEQLNQIFSRAVGRMGAI